MSLYLLNIIHWLETHQLPCLFKTITHFDCPGCGMQRSFILLMKGDLSGSLMMFPALIPIILLFAFLSIHVMAGIRNGANILKYAYILCAGIIMVSYIYRLIVTKTL
ncbi:MAG: DUF2752 domain-containing protein [Ferruginibacter sp.]|nr:DUF2752 domain-containing protein [Chitinophagaceae bacterium]